MHKAFVATILTSLAVVAEPAGLDQARKLYQRTEYTTALRLLESLASRNGPALALAGKAHYGKGSFKEASEALARAVSAEPRNSHYWHWLGKAYGRRAENSSFITAPRYASKCRGAFEKAVELDAANLAAISDLFSYYLEAPGILGGGFDKAARLAERIGELDQAEYHYAQAELAKKRNEFASAGQQLRTAAEVAPTQVGRLLDLASFLAERGRVDESDAVFRRARELAPGNPKVLFEMAGACIEANRKLDEARELLERYLAAELTPDDPPRAEAEKLLRKVKK